MREETISHQQSSTDSDSAYGSSIDGRLRPLNQNIVINEHDRPYLHPHYNLTTRSYQRHVSVCAPVDHGRSKPLSDLTPLTMVPETPAKTPAIQGIIISHADTPIKASTSGDDEIVTDTQHDNTHSSRNPALTREISCADNIPAVSLNDCLFTPSSVIEECRPLAQRSMMMQDSAIQMGSNINQSPYFNEAESKAQVPFLDHHVLECDSSGKVYTNTEHDITLRVPEGAVAAGEKIRLEVGVAMFGPFNFPDGTQPISPILWLCPLEENVQLKKPLQIILPHFLTGVTRERLLYHQICLAKASHSNFTFHDQQLYYDFQLCDVNPLFASSGQKSYGMILINHFCFYCLLAKQTPELATDAGYCLVRIESFLTPQRTEIFFSVVYFLDTCLKVKFVNIAIIAIIVKLNVIMTIINSHVLEQS